MIGIDASGGKPPGPEWWNAGAISSKNHSAVKDEAGFQKQYSVLFHSVPAA
jgi:hypothetical protein